MDPVSALGVAAASAQFAEQAINLSLVLFDYIQKVKEAPKLARQLQQELCMISLLLKELHLAAESIKSTEISPELTDNLKTSVAEFSDTIVDMEKQVAIRKDEFIKRLKWPFSEKEHEEYLEKFERCKTTFTLVLTMIQRYSYILQSEDKLMRNS